MSDGLPAEFTIKERDLIRGVTYVTNAWRDDSGEWHADGRIQILGLGITLYRFPPEKLAAEQAATMYDRYTVIEEIEQ